MKRHKSKVFWTTEERAIIVAESANLLLETPELSSLSLLRSAQKSLPPSRRRKIVALSQIPWFEPSLRGEVSDRMNAQEPPGFKEYRDAIEEFKESNLAVLREVSCVLKSIRCILQHLDIPWKDDPASTDSTGVTPGEKDKDGRKPKG